MLLLKVLALIVVCVSSFPVNSEELSVDPSVAVVTQYTDNVRMSAITEEDSTGYTVQPRVNLIAKEGELWNTSLEAAYRGVRFSGIDDADSDNYFLDADGAYSTETNQIGFKLSYQDNTNYDQDVVTQSGQTGLHELLIKRKVLAFSPFWYWSISRKETLVFRLNASDQEYDDDAPANYNDFESKSAELSYYWNQSLKTKYGLTASQAKTESRELEYDNDSQTFQFSIDYSFSRNSVLNLVLGRTKLDYFYRNVPVCEGTFFLGTCYDNSSLTPIPLTLKDLESNTSVRDYSFGYTNQTEVSEINLSLGQNVTNSSSGSATQIDEISFDYSRRFSRRLKSSLLLIYTKLKSLDELDTDQDKESYRFEPSVSWRLAENWNLHFSYRYLRHEFTVSKLEAESNTAYINLTLNWPKAASTY